MLQGSSGSDHILDNYQFSSVYNRRANEISTVAMILCFFAIKSETNIQLMISEKRAGGRLTGKDIQQLAKEHYNAHYTVNGIYELLKRIDMSWISARSQHPKADIQAQDAFKKTL